MIHHDIHHVHADLLSKYNEMFPVTFIDSIRTGVTWLCAHNGITYQTSTMIKTDTTVYTNNASILKIGLIDVDQPLSGLTYYDVKKVTEETDSVSGNTIFNLELAYKYPAGIKVKLIPVRYYEPKLKPERKFYTKVEIDNKLADYYTKIETDLKLADYYNKTDIELKLQEITDKITEVTTDLQNLKVEVDNIKNPGIVP